MTSNELSDTLSVSGNEAKGINTIFLSVCRVKAPFDSAPGSDAGALARFLIGHLPASTLEDLRWKLARPILQELGYTVT